MKNLAATVDREDLMRALRWTALSKPKRPPLQVLLGVMISVDDRGMRLFTTDYESAAYETIPAIGGRGQALVPYDTLAAFVRELPKGAAVRLESERSRLTVTGGEHRVRMPLLPIADYPADPAPVPTFRTSLTAEQLAGVVRPAVAAGRDDTLPVLTGVLLEAHEGRLEVAATDRYRLGVQVVDVPWEDRVLAPAGPLVKAARMLAKEPAMWLGWQGASGSARTLHLAAGNRQWWTRCLDGEFPRYRSLLPAADALTVMIEMPREQTAQAVRIARLAGRHMPIRLTVDQNEIVVECGQDVDSDTYAVTRVPVKVEGAIDQFALNDLYLLDALQILKGDRVTFHGTGPTRPGIWTSPEMPGFRYLLMPIRLNG